MAFLRDVELFEKDRTLYQGSYGGKSVRGFHILGRRTSFSGTTAYEDIGEFLTGSSFSFPTGAETWEVVSSSANDTAAGTGARTIQIHYLDNSWIPQTTNVTMNGTTPVAVAALANCQAIQWAHSVTVGSGGVAAGNIDVRISGAGAVHERILAGGNQSLSCRYTVPDGHFVTIREWSAGCGTNHQQNVLLWATAARYSRVLQPGVFLFQDIMFLDNDSQERFFNSTYFPARCRIKVSTITANVNANVASSFHVTLYQI